MPDTGIIVFPSDFSYSISGYEFVNNRWTFTIIHTANFSGYDEFRQAVLNWTLRAMACFYTGSCEG
ncbi:hypothetical protein, partial [Methanobrevibacter sp.]|uniref:hypothetical protein n=1 Tax=Methanobrevibacter sp. TaxID=66852 RepID=UPI00388D3C73